MEKKPMHECGACKRSEMILQPINFVLEGHIYRTHVLVCTNKACVRKRGGHVVKYRAEEGPDNMAKNRGGT